MDVFEAIRNRRSIRHYKNDPIDDKTLEAVLEAAHWAPSWGNMQCWRFITVRDPETKSQIADTLRKITILNYTRWENPQMKMPQMEGQIQ